MYCQISANVDLPVFHLVPGFDVCYFSVIQIMSFSEDIQLTCFPVTYNDACIFQIGGKVKSVAGKPGEVICHVADEENATFIICGTRGHGRLRRTFLGSISDYILHHAHVPVFVCRHKDSHKDITGHHHHH